MPEILVVLLAGIGAGALNAVGGAGKFVAVPALVAVGMPAVLANAATTVALAPSAAASAWVYRRELAPVGPVRSRALTMVSLVGGAVGASLLIVLPSESFEVLVPWLLAFATLILAFGRRISALLRATMPGTATLTGRSVLIGQFVLATYGGYFGGAVGIMMLALWSAGLGLDTAQGNPMRTAQLAAIYLPATGLFLIASDVLTVPVPLAMMLCGALAGGIGGAHLARRLPAWLVRGIVLTIAVAMTVLYFLRG